MNIKRVAVLGAGVMGSQIAAHLANAGIPSDLFDLTQEAAEKGLQAAVDIKPAAFFIKKDAKMVTPCNYDEHLDRLSDCDWVIEVIGERLEWKHDLYKKIEPHLKADAILTSNTSSLPIPELTKHFPEALKKRFFITHFFNPPRYLKLLELIAGEETELSRVDEFARFGEDVLGKTIVYGKNTAGFVANRIGMYGIMLTIQLQQKYGIPIHMVDKFTGRLIGRPKSATFRTADVVGLDTLVNVANSLYTNCPDDPEREMFKVPEFLQKMVEGGMLGSKTKQGFMKKDKSSGEIHNINFKTLTYEPQEKVKYEAYRVAKDQDDLAKRLRAVVRLDDDAGKFMHELIIQSCMYAAARIPEIADDIIQIDNALKTGFGWDIGPFEVLDAIGSAYAAESLKKAGKPIPEIVQKMLSNGFDSFYKLVDGVLHYFDYERAEYVAQPADERVIKLDYIKQSSGVIERNWCASLIDIGDGVACLQFHSILQKEMNPVDGSIMDMLRRAPKLVEREGFKGMVLGHQGTHFSAGANLQFVLGMAKMKLYPMVEQMTEQFQEVNQGMRFAPFPVVSAPFSLTLGGGYEMISSADLVVAAAETYTGLVEVGAGLIPGGGGCLRVLMNWQDQINNQAVGSGWGKKAMGPFPVVQKTFETVAYGKVSTSAKEAYKLGYFRPHDQIVMNQNHQIAKAKAEVLRLAENYETPVERDDLHLPGNGGKLAIDVQIKQLQAQGVISEHDGLIASHLATILTGGRFTNGINRVTESQILELEREAFMSLVAEPKTQDRMAYILKNGKPLRN